MKKIILLMGVTSLVAVGCSSNGGGDSQPAPAKNKPSENPPQVGMTKDQIIAMYGKTSNIQQTSSGETWIYNTNMGEAFIPFNYGWRPKTRIIVFDHNGQVVSWSYTK